MVVRVFPGTSGLHLADQVLSKFCSSVIDCDLMNVRNVYCYWSNYTCLHVVSLLLSIVRCRGTCFASSRRSRNVAHC